jgi:hypothetical protein
LSWAKYSSPIELCAVNGDVQFPSWVIVAAAVITALPFGWGLGVIAAYLLAGPSFGQLPALTVPLGIIAAIRLRPIADAECTEAALDHGRWNHALHPAGALSTKRPPGSVPGSINLQG